MLTSKRETASCRTQPPAFTLLILGTCFLLPAHGLAAEFNVSSSTELQNALTAAETNGESNTIHLAAGTYLRGDEHFRYSGVSPLVISGAGMGKTVLDGGKLGRVLQIDGRGSFNDVGPQISLQDLTIHNGRLDAALQIDTSNGDVMLSDVSFTRNVIFPNTVGEPEIKGGAALSVFTESGAITLRYCTFTGNYTESTATGNVNGGAAHLQTDIGAINLTGNTFDDNGSISAVGSSAGGGVAALTSLGTVVLVANRFNNNFAISTFGTCFGGGASIGGSVVVLTTNIFTDNAVASLDGFTFGAGVDVNAGPGAIILANNTFTLNKGSGRSSEGGGARLVASQGSEGMFVFNNIIFNNSAIRGADISAPVFFSRVFLSLFNNNYRELFDGCEASPITCPEEARDNVSGDPMFVDASRGNIHLLPGSPAVNAGIVAPDLPERDFEGDSRVGAPDIGADEQNNMLATGTGLDVSVRGNSVTVGFSVVDIAGNTTVSAIDPNGAGALPGRFILGADLPAFEVSTTAAVDGPTLVCIEVPTVSFQPRFNALRILHGEGAELVDRTILPPDEPAPDFSARRICARVNSLSAFVVAELADAGENVNSRVSIAPLPASFITAESTQGCGTGSFVGTFQFDGKLTNTASRSIANLGVQVTTLTGGNLLQNGDAGPAGVGASITLPNAPLGVGESLTVPFRICLRNRSPFTFLVDVVGLVQ